MSVVYINEQGSYLRKQGGCFIVTKKDETLFSIPEASVDEVVILGNVQLSTQAMSELLQQGIEVIFLSTNGKFKGILEPGYPKNVFMRIAQYEASIKEEISFHISAWLVKNKIKYQLDAFRRWQNNRWLESIKPFSDEMHNYIRLLDSKSDLQGILGIEGITAKIYFSVLPEVIPPPFEWNGRSRQPPRDPVNALFSLTYMMALGSIISKCYIHSLDPYIGFLHQLDYSRPSFALDILELCRSIFCDHFVISLLQKEMFEIDDFSFSEKHGCRLKPEPFKKYLHEFHSLRTVPGKNKGSLDLHISEILQDICKSFKTGQLAELKH